MYKLQGFICRPKMQSVTKSNVLQIKRHSNLLNKESWLAAFSTGDDISSYLSFDPK